MLLVPLTRRKSFQIMLDQKGSLMGWKPFSDDELNVKDVIKVRGTEVELFHTPITSKENIRRLYEGKTPLWIPCTAEMIALKPDCDPEVIARSPSGGIDGWGVEWVWEGVGAMVRPGKPKVPDITQWESCVTVPDPDTWDWESCYERMRPQIRPDHMLQIATASCMFERLIAVMDFGDAAIALIDDEEKEAVHRFFRAVTDSRKKYLAQVKKWFNPDVVTLSDDWGSQRAEFFSVSTAREMIMPYLQELCSYAHQLGILVDLHCCGFVESFVPLFIEEGFDSWGGQALNGKAKLKAQYGDQMVFTHGLYLPKNAKDAEIRAAAESFVSGIGADNRVFYNDQYIDPRAHRLIYELSRKQFDRLVAEGKAIL